jgi:hypothetical protein
MTVIILAPHIEGQPNPPPAPINYLGENDSFANLEEHVGLLSTVLDQDMSNLPFVQEGLRASGTNEMNFAQYTESHCRQRNHLIHRIIEAGQARDKQLR